jgi:hypothetical protein
MASVKIEITFDTETNKIAVNAPIEDEQHKKGTLDILITAMKVVNDYEPKKIVVAAQAPN